MKPVGINYIRDSIACGKLTFTRDAIAKDLGRRGDLLNKILQRLQRGGWVLPIGSDFFTIVDSQNKDMGCIPPPWFIDAWAKFKGVQYYVGGLSAAELHGAAHQRVQVFQVVVDHSMRAFQLPSVRVRFLYRQIILSSMWQTMKVPTGYFRVSTPEMTAYDLFSLRNACPSLDHLATVFVELGAAMSSRRVTGLGSMELETPVLQRLGWMLDRTGWAKLTGGLEKSLMQRRRDWIPLLRRMPVRGARNQRWRIIENTDVQPDIGPGVDS